MAGDNAQPAADAAASTLQRRSVGEILRAARNAQGLSLEQIATELRIEMPQLEALEGDSFERTGTPPVFVKGYLRQYGARLGLDYRDLLAQYYKQTSPHEVLVQPSKTIKLHDERQVTVWVIAALAILVVAAGLAAWWLGGGGFDVGVGHPAAPAGTDDGAKPAAAAAPAPATSKTTTPAGAGAPPPPVEAVPSAVPGTATPGATPPAASGAPSATAAPVVGAPAPAARPAATRPGGSSPPAAAATLASNAGAASTAVPLELKFEQESWAEVTDARGERLYYGLGAAGRRAELRGEPPFAVVLGNATGVKIAVDGEDFTVPTKDGPGEYARFSVDVTTD
jgi:cytoskeleton protein RodZ